MKIDLLNQELEDITKEEDLNKDYEIRLAKVEKLKELGISAWPEFNKNNTDAFNATEIINSQNFIDSDVWTMSGRLMLKRDHGKSFFGTLKDVTGSIQVYIKLDTVGQNLFDIFVKYIDLGDFLWVSGNPFVTKTGQATIKVNDFKLLSKCLRPLPEKFHGLTDIEVKYRQRYLDLICNPESKTRFETRSKVVTQIRNFLLHHNFLEVETPMLHPIAGGAAAKPFLTHHNTCGMDLALRIAPELYLKRLVVGGLERVFEINRNFRNEGMSTKHNPEFTMLEFYMAYGNCSDGVRLLKEMLQSVAMSINPSGQFIFGLHNVDFANAFEVLDMKDSIIKFAGYKDESLKKENIDDLISKENISIPHVMSYGEKIFAIFEEKVEAKLIQPTFITGYPVEVSPLAKKDPNDETKTVRFELFVCGVEIANGYTELNDPLDQAERFKQQLKSKNDGNVEAHDYDHDYILALEYGLPPTVGVGLGIDRLIMLLTNTQSIKDVILFPTLKLKA
jgi:lysyl-tRNA synthetase class 2